MKIKKEHYDHIKKEMFLLVDKIKQHRKFIINEGKAKDIEMRLRWDVFSSAKLHKFACDVLYTYLNDNHIDTALKQIMKEIEKDFNTIKCNQCNASMINGVFCHEHGCPNSKKTWIPDREQWVEFVDCRDCGFPVEVGEICECMKEED